jgi:hypothetical protein
MIIASIVLFFALIVFLHYNNEIHKDETRASKIKNHEELTTSTYYTPNKTIVIKDFQKGGNEHSNIKSREDKCDFNNMLPGENIPDDIKKYYIKLLSEAGFKQGAYDRYVKEGLTIKVAREFINFNNSIGLSGRIAGRGSGTKGFYFKMPHLTLVFDDPSELLKKNGVKTKTFITIHNKAIDPKNVPSLKTIISK